MNGNQGLEALAALCGGEAAVATDASNAHGNNTLPNESNVGGTCTISVHPSPSAHTMTAQQQWQQAMAAAAALSSAAGASTMAPGPATTGLTTAQGLALLSAAGLQPTLQQQLQVQQQQPPQQPSLDSNAALAAMQQLAYFRYIQDQTSAAIAKIGQNAAASASVNMNPLLNSNPHQAVALALAGQAQQLQQQLTDASRQQVVHSAAPLSATTSVGQTDSSSSSVSSMPPPSSAPNTVAPLSSTPGIGSLNGSTTTASKSVGATSSTRHHTAIAPLPKASSFDGPMSGVSNDSSRGSGVVAEDKKLQKRAANRRSAQLSRKRKKQFIEELKDENDELRRKEQILRSIPDLIVVFDSTGKLWFVSQSVSRFMNMTASELEGTSFWDRLCEDSVRLLKAAFMDSLAARTDDAETAPLGSGIWELRLVDKDGGHKVVTLNGVVHFSGDRPECVCSIRPRDDPAMLSSNRKQRKNDEASKSNVKNEEAVGTPNGGNEASASNASNENERENSSFQPLIRAKPHQSVISNSSSGDSALVNQKVKAGGGGKRREAARISDGDSGSADSGSSDEMGE